MIGDFLLFESFYLVFFSSSLFLKALVLPFFSSPFWMKNVGWMRDVADFVIETQSSSDHSNLHVDKIVDLFSTAAKFSFLLFSSVNSDILNYRQTFVAFSSNKYSKETVNCVIYSLVISPLLLHHLRKNVPDKRRQQVWQ